ncbi:SDR family oxidoreductase [Kineosporia sp. NBRC 101731]|uniref:SDR family NAD(P)-dependent oxidoreductase n=1 Tax=Kineosporia sp. NBRC 101731 TaxID=3032199 RepID=UPI0024A295DF|nr:SDR family oxidoreductase [Kineosporia sp. NBRC 101731]GLY31023.1 bifunctional dihydropteridine reductase/dihydrofolate reductase TmpR [Kineosporia sp. NBRC 101731]
MTTTIEDASVALVAGGTGPLGRAVVATLAGRGLRVAVHYRSRPETAQELIAGLPGEHLVVGADLTSPGELADAVDTVEHHLGPVSVLVNAAHPGLSSPAAVADGDPAALAAQLAGVSAHAALCARVVPAMRALGRGRIIYLSGALMSRPATGFGFYGAAKAAATTLTKYLALEEGRAGITANIVAPGRVVDPSVPDELTPQQAALSDRLLERMALPRFPSPADVADGVLTLVDSPAITGQVLWLTGGEPIHG